MNVEPTLPPPYFAVQQKGRTTKTWTEQARGYNHTVIRKHMMRRLKKAPELKQRLVLVTEGGAVHILEGPRR